MRANVGKWATARWLHKRSMRAYVGKWATARWLHKRSMRASNLTDPSCVLPCPALPCPALLLPAVATFAKRAVVFASFVFAKQPARIRQVLNQVGAEGWCVQGVGGCWRSCCVFCASNTHSYCAHTVASATVCCWFWF